jgi:hypothetical protein
MGRITRFAPAGLLVAGLVLSGCQFQLRDDWEFLRSSDDPQIGMNYAARLQARKKQPHKPQPDSDEDASDPQTRSGDSR